MGGFVSIEFEDPDDARVYADWIPALVQSVFGSEIDLHHDLYELSHAHRLEHGPDTCDSWPSPPSRAPLWSILADMVKARRFLEVGCGLGYTAALMAHAGGLEARVDTIEIDTLHADIAERELSRKGLAARVRVIRGAAGDILPSLVEPYDVVFDDGGAQDSRGELRRLTRGAGVLIDSGVKRSFSDKVWDVLDRANKRLGKSAEGDRKAIAQAAAAREYREVVRDLVGAQGGTPAGAAR